MKVEDLAMEIWREVRGGEISDDDKYILIDFTEAVQQACSFILKREFWDLYNKTGEPYIDSNYLETYEEVPVKYNSVNGRYYIETPTDIFSLPKDYGVVYVGYNKNLNDPFARLTIGNASFFSKLPTDVINWMLTSNQIQFTNFDPAIKNVTLVILPANPKEINADDAWEIKDMVLKQFMPTNAIPEDKINNSNPNE